MRKFFILIFFIRIFRRKIRKPLTWGAFFRGAVWALFSLLRIAFSFLLRSTYITKKYKKNKKAFEHRNRAVDLAGKKYFFWLAGVARPNAQLVFELFAVKF